MGGDDDYEFMTSRCFSYLQQVAESCTTDAHSIMTQLIKSKSNQINVYYMKD